MIIKAISLHQPFASMIASGAKTIETRTWYTSYRGDLLIVSTKKPVIKPVAEYPTGKALCIVKLVGCRRMTIKDEAAACCQFYPGAYAWLLDNIRTVPPIAVRGSQGFYNVAL